MAASVALPVIEPLDHVAKYAVNARALNRWLGERLTLNVQEDGSVDALFRYDGTTCSNMGRSFVFHYHVKLGPREGGYVILEQRCQPAPGDEGHRHMCRYMNNAEHLMVAIEHEKPLAGQKLNDVLAWHRPATGAGCYCEPASRKHKWGLALETIHFALVQKEERGSEHTMKKPLHEACLDRALLGDGAMGTQLMIAGLAQGAAAKNGISLSRKRCSASKSATPTQDRIAS